ncbi:hypothetical protein TrLO_g2758 [Triparma laevis f. longispina]|uniref:Uncharacterized protein n=1 Tax=Triparma laevis f. longispina TaxID=1714387 RepID=A0A9W7L108_9STRA|nr:hypothetical protein TrLO_g2758 [Triparma laevis f. longispina]
MMSHPMPPCIHLPHHFSHSSISSTPNSAPSSPIIIHPTPTDNEIALTKPAYIMNALASTAFTETTTTSSITKSTHPPVVSLSSSPSGALSFGSLRTYNGGFSMNSMMSNSSSPALFSFESVMSGKNFEAASSIPALREGNLPPLHPRKGTTSLLVEAWMGDEGGEVEELGDLEEDFVFDEEQWRLSSEEGGLF